MTDLDYEKLWKDFKVKILRDIEDGKNNFGLSYVYREMCRKDGTLMERRKVSKPAKVKKPPEKPTTKKRSKEDLKKELMSIYGDEEK